MQSYELYLQETILPELEKGRPGWDLPHTVNVVHYAKKLSELHTDINLDIQVIVAYLHDYGYMYFRNEHKAGTTSKGNAKKEHAKHSLKKWEEIQTQECFNFLNEKQKERIGHLILVHDHIYELKDKDEFVFMEADTLGAPATVNVNTNYAHWRYWYYILRTKEKRISRFVTPWAKEEMHRILSEVIHPKTTWHGKLRANIFNYWTTLFSN